MRNPRPAYDVYIVGKENFLTCFMFPTAAPRHAAPLAFTQNSLNNLQFVLIFWELNFVNFPFRDVSNASAFIP